MKIKHELFGFLIDNDIQFDIANKRLTRISTLASEHSIVMSTVLLNGSMARLLTFLLTARSKSKEPVPKHDIFKYVWEDIGFSGSSQQLWKTMHALKLKLTHIGLNQDFIIKTGGAGYLVTKENINSLYVI